MICYSPFQKIFLQQISLDMFIPFSPLQIVCKCIWVDEVSVDTDLSDEKMKFNAPLSHA
jgi:hypothetical protein